MARLDLARVGGVCAALALLVACGCRPKTHCPTPAASGINSRDLIDRRAQAESEELIGVDRFLRVTTERGARIREDLLKTAPPGRPERNVLCLSGGGSFGAYSAGVLCGWTERGDRPVFDVVTGISTGSLISPFAFLGPKYDAQLKEFYTTLTNDDIFKQRPVRGLLGGEAFADTAPLRKKVGGVITPELMGELATAHQAGRRLFVGTTEVEGGRFVLWDIGEIASRNGPGDRDLIIDVLMGSSALPGIFPPAKIDVTVDGRCYTERHQDGGMSQGVFFHPPYVPPAERTAETLNPVGTNVYVIVAGKLYTDAAVVQGNALSGAGQAVSTVLTAQVRGDLARMWTYCVVNGMAFRMTAIPAAFAETGSGAEFDPRVMSGLFEEGRRQICAGTAWRSNPPGTGFGELAQMRSGRCLTFEPRGPQLPINGPKKSKIPPRITDLVPVNTSGGSVIPLDSFSK